MNLNQVLYHHNVEIDSLIKDRVHLVEGISLIDWVTMRGNPLVLFDIYVSMDVVLNTQFLNKVTHAN